MLFLLFILTLFLVIPKPSLAEDGKQVIKTVCAKCHKPGSFKPNDKSAAQWQALIGDDEHAILAEIPWSNPDQKAAVLDFLKKHASDSKLAAEGIGVWQ